MRPTRIAHHLLALFLVAVGTLAGAGCAPSAWQPAYRPSPLATPGTPDLRYPADHPVLVREAPWDRVEPALTELDRQEAESAIHISQWPESQRLDAVARLLSALQLQDDPASVTILGSASFATTDNIRPEGGSLAAMARRVGADYAIWTSRYLGQGTRVVDRPVTVHHHGWGSYYDRHDHVWRQSYYSDLDTAWVPVVIEAERFAYVAFFVRRSVLSTNTDR